MSDLSLPPLTLLPPQDMGFLWPTPAVPGYPSAERAPAPELVEIEGNNGHTMSGRLVFFDPLRGSLQLRLAGSRTPMTLRFDQFRRLTVLAPLAAVPDFDQETVPGGLLGDRPLLPFHLQFKNAPAWDGQTLGQHEDASGLFLFIPMDDSDSVQRVFVPASACTGMAVGHLLGATLVEKSLATSDQVAQALAEQHELRQRTLGDILLVKQIISADDLAQAIEQQARMPMVRIGEALTALGFITEAQLEDALAQQRQDRSVPLGELLVRKGLVSRADLETALARKMGYPMVDVVQFTPDSDAVTRLPYAVAARVPALPLIYHAGRLVVAMEDPSSRTTIDELEFAAQCKLLPVLARSGVLLGAIDKAYEKIGAAVFVPRVGDPGDGIDFEPGDAGRLLATLEQQTRSEARASDQEDVQIEQSDNSLVRLINSMIQEAQAQGVSDIHIECPPGREKVRIRFRKDGQLRAYLDLPHTYRSALVARIKIMCDLDISERRKPQDGKINFSKFVAGSKLELRVATIPTQGNHEDAVLRLLTSARPLPLEQLGLSPHNLARFQAAVLRPNGMVLCVGPTGSGKTTTLHSAMASINKPERKIWTAEDPVEITQPGLRQVQVNPKIDWTFAKALRAFLRADPDVIMVGEIRDQETAQVAIEASLTGHLVMSTLHTNSAPETVTRLLDMGMDPFNFADALLVVLAQRLVRRLCSHCRTARNATPEEEDELVQDYLNAFIDPAQRPGAEVLRDDWRSRYGQGGRLKLYSCQGCERCDGTGLRGRAGIHELMSVSRPLRHLIQTGQRADELLREAQADGMRTLRQDGIEKVLVGLTTIEEVRANS
jgi:type II secretory ATPase GspE/PulE/Tfp pilus assembly ATPase PilB-like protein